MNFYASRPRFSKETRSSFANLRPARRKHLSIEPRTLLAQAMTKKDKSGVEVTGERYADMQQMIIEFGGGKGSGW